MILLMTSSCLAAPAEWVLQNNCHIFVGNKHIRKFPGVNCIFLEDGSFLSTDYKFLHRIGPAQDIKWSLPGFFHHQMNLSHDRKRVLLLGSDAVTHAGEVFRQDTVVVTDLGGKVLHEKALYDFLLKRGNFLAHAINPVWTEIHKGHPRREISHFNSIHEIPPQLPGSFFRAGDIIINSTVLGIFVLDPTLQELRAHFLVPDSRHHQVHDVQVLPNGNLLFFNNEFSGGRVQKMSAIQEMNPRTMKTVFRFDGSESFPFYSSAGGSVQSLGDDLLLYTHYMTGTYVVNRKTREVVFNTHLTHFIPGSGVIFSLSVRHEPRLKEFLKSAGL